jgi:hypothetical protein
MHSPLLYGMSICFMNRKPIVHSTHALDVDALSCFSLFLNYIWWLEHVVGNIKLLNNNEQLLGNGLHEGYSRGEGKLFTWNIWLNYHHLNCGLAILLQKT